MTIYNRAFGARFLLTACCVLALSTQAATTNYYHVVSSGSATPPYGSWGTAATDIQTAVDRAQADLVPGTTECVVLVSNGLYAVSSQISVTNAITLRSVSGNAADTTIRGSYPARTNRCLYLTGGAMADGFTITNGSTDAQQPLGNNGAGAYLSGGVLNNCTVIGNITVGSASKGCGIMMEGSSMVSNCAIMNNRALWLGQGAGGYVGGGVMMDCVITGNNGLSTSPSVGGLYVTYGRVLRCFIGGNTGRSGGVFLDSGSFLSDSIVSNNVSLNSAAAISLTSTGYASNCLVVAHRIPSTGTLISYSSGGTLHSCAIVGNFCRSSMIAMNNGTLMNCLVAGNSTDNNIIYMSDNGLIENCTIVKNQASISGGGILATPPDAIIRNTISYDNDAPSNANWLVTNTNTPVLEYNCTDIQVPGTSNMIANPIFMDPGTGYGTNAVLGDYRLAQNSPCVNAGKNQAWMTVGFDLDGNPRIRPYVGGRVDIGCFEALPLSLPLTAYALATPLWGRAPLQVVLTPVADGDTNGLLCRWDLDGIWVSGWMDPSKVTTVFEGGFHTVSVSMTNSAGESASRTYTNLIKSSPAVLYVDRNGGHQSPYDTWESAATNIQTAVDLAGPRVSVVRIGSGVYTIGRDLVISNAVEVRGDSGNPADTIIRGAYPATTNRCLTISGAGALVDGLTLMNGFTTATGSDGAGVLISAAATLQNCIIKGNTSSGASLFGGGIHMTGAGTVRQCLIMANTNVSASTTTEGGGGINMTAGLLENCVIVSNFARLSGGGVLLRETAAMRGCLVAGNQSKTGGGVQMALKTGAKQRIDNCTVVGNLATNGGGVYSLQAVAAATNCIVMFNGAVLGQPDIGGTFTNFAYSCSSALTPGVNGNINANPLFENPGSGYGLAHRPGSYRLKSGSPCVDTGALLPWMTASALDLEGEPRNQGAGPNRGAYETTLPSEGTLILIR